MKLFILSLFFNYYAFSAEIKHEIEKFAYFNHDYICFDHHYFIHDPDCSCQNHWIGKIIKDPNTDISYVFINKGSESLLDD
jgi:hypothetical protein